MLKSDLLFLTAAVFVLCGLYAVFHGMFLTSEPIPNNSGLSLLDDSPQWFESKSKVIMLVIDGLRFDYLFKDEEIPQKELYKLGKFQVFNELLQTSPENIVVCKTFADTPTLTVQKIPSIVTGTMAPKVNVIMAFGALPIKEDNLMRQATLAGFKPYFSGDSLWNGFFPNDLIDTTDTRDFDIKNPNADVKSIDFIEHVIKKKKWKLIIGHLLAVDHMGHTYGLGDKRVEDAINNMDKMIRDIIELMDDDTTLMVVGDHGMTFAGEHIHDTPGETNTAIVGYNKKGFQKYKQKNLSEIMTSINETKKLVKQEDFTPTISMLLGLPIPYSNMGQILSDMYPVESFPQLESCPEASFEVQLLRDHYLNTLQIRQYFKENQNQNHLFKPSDLHYIKKLFQEIESDYQKSQEVVKNPESCTKIHDMAINLIKKCQFFSTEVYRITRNTGSYNELITMLGIFSLILVAVCYLLITQFIYNYGHQEKNTDFTLKNISSGLKKLIPLAIVLPIITTAAWYFGLKRGIYGFAAAFLTLILWFIGSLSISFIKKQEDSASDKITSPTDNQKILAQSNSSQAEDAQTISINAAALKKEDNTLDSEDLPPTTSGTIKGLSNKQDQSPIFSNLNENTPFLPSRALFLLQDYKYVIGLALILGYSMYLIHIKNFLVLDLRYWKPVSPYIGILLIGYRIGTIFRNKMAFIMIATIALCGYIHFENIRVSRIIVRTTLGLLLASDWVHGEVYYLVKGLKTNRLWGLSHFISFGLVALFNSLNIEGFWVEIALPRAVWAVMLVTLILRKVFKVEPAVWKRNAQLCLVILLFLFRRKREVLPLAILLLVMRYTIQLFSQKANKRNYLLPFMLAFEAYIGMHFLQLTDVLIPFNFTVAFIGFANFNIIISPLIYLLNYLSTFILAFVHFSYHHQYLDAKVDITRHIELQDDDEDQVSEENKSEILSIGHVKIMKKRNILLYLPYFNLVMISACVRLFVFRESEFFLVFEKFFMDALLYLFAIGVGYFML